MWPRKPHSKSRNGCNECKRRHIKAMIKAKAHKCDETRPRCEKCRSSVRECQFSTKGRSSIISPMGSSTQSTVSSSPGTFLPDPYAEPCEISGLPPVFMPHIELFHHFSTEIIKSLETYSDGSTFPLFKIVKISLSTPYLMNQILALASLHLSLVRPLQRERYHDQATQLQSHAIMLFNSVNLEITQDNCMPAFLFSSILGTHMLCETLRFREGDLGVFLARFCQYATLHRGVRTIAGASWTTLRQFHVDNLWQFDKAFAPSNPRLSQACADLLRNIHAAKLGPLLTGHYERAIELLPLQVHQDDQPTKPIPWSSVVAWPVHVPDEYLEHLTIGRPEALVILAHYGVLLHHHRDFWVFGDAGQCLVEAIKDQLGPTWQSWLAWPLDAIAKIQ